MLVVVSGAEIGFAADSIIQGQTGVSGSYVDAMIALVGFTCLLTVGVLLIRAKSR